ncbi:GNAT family N-acetyltransferase [Pseudooceanicola sp. HF7]|uniref:GNAT family N-acetyltransferase n=1 Tax=Pseudooceanicola sp. HF7 TaxID=2721560 RepID=UPI001C37C9E0|nr:N-acetyltransferase [Pseudooceanicola sp. HF7]
MLRLYAAADEIGVSNVLTQSYDTPAEARLVSSLREKGELLVELVAKDEDTTVGYIGFSKHLNPEGWVALAPLAVIPQCRDRGVGADLVRYGLDYARRAGARAVTVLGDGRYYQRFGFTYKAAKNLTTPYSIENTLLYPIAAGTAFAEERLVYSSAFDAFSTAPTR